jgi:Flp pilus assembly pilin Flp
MFRIPMRDLLDSLLKSERGQDLIEYALLTASFGIIGIATWPLIVTAVGTAYRNLDTRSQNLWVPPDPGGTP